MCSSDLIGGIACTVVGILPNTFHFPESMRPDLNKGVWLPLQPSAEMLKDRSYNFFKVVGELRPGVTVRQAQRELDAIAARIPRAKDEGKVAFQAGLYQEILTGPVRPVLFGLFGALALVLLIACANVSNLLIARCLGRQQEFAVRAALGASRRRLIRQMLSEGLALSLFGCGAGAGLAQLAMIGVRKLTGTIPNAEAISIHWTVVLVLAAIAILTTVLSSLLPALLVARVHPQAALQAASRGLGSRTVSGKLSGTLVATEVALSTLLLVGTGLLFHTLWNLEQSHLGFDAARVTSFGAMPADVAGSASAAVSDDTANAPISVAALTYEPMLERIRRVPGIESAALVTSPPLVGGENIHSTFEVVGRPDDPAHEMGAQVTAVSGDYARTLGTPIVRGRMIESGDGSTAPSVIAINETLAKKYFPGTDPLGKQIDLGGKETGMLKPFTIVGILGDQVDTTVGSAPRPLLFLSQQQIPTTSIFYPFLLKTIVRFVVKTRGDIPLAVEMRSLFKQNAPGFALDDFRTMQEAVDQNTFNQRLGLYLVGSFAGLAVAMVFAGLYGVLSQLVSYRKREIGVRMALGATRLSVAQLVLRQGSLLVGAGLAVGLALALATGRLVSSFLYQVKPLDAFTYAGVVLAVALIGLAAALLPARKAASIEPMQALRED